MVRKFLAYNGESFFNVKGEKIEGKPTKQDLLDKGTEDYSLLTKRNTEQNHELQENTVAELNGTINRITIKKSDWHNITSINFAE